jgi:hypothetical protein
MNTKTCYEHFAAKYLFQNLKPTQKCATFIRVDVVVVADFKLPILGVVKDCLPCKIRDSEIFVRNGSRDGPELRVEDEGTKHLLRIVDSVVLRRIFKTPLQLESGRQRHALDVICVHRRGHVEGLKKYIHLKKRDVTIKQR